MRVQTRKPLNFETTLPTTDIVKVAVQNLANRQVGFAAPTTGSAAQGVHPRQAACASAPCISVPCDSTASSETLLHAFLTKHEPDPNVTATNH